MDKSATKSSQRLSNRIWRGVTLQLFLVAVLPLTVLVLIVTFGSLKLHHEAMRSLVGDRNLLAVQSAAANIDKDIYQRGQILEMLTNQVARSENPASVFKGIEIYLATYDGGIAIVNSDGGVIYSEGSPLASEWATKEFPKIINTLNNYGKAEFLQAIKNDNQYFIPVIVKTSSELSLIGLFSPQQLLTDSLSVVTNSGPVIVVVVDQNNQFLFQKGLSVSANVLATNPGIQMSLEGDTRINYYPSSEGEHVITTSPIKSMGWVLLIEESWEDIASPLLRATQNAPIILIPIIALSLMAIWFGLRQIVQPMQALEEKAGDLAQGNFASIRQPVGGVPEIRHLQETLVRMAEQLEEAQTSLHNYVGAITETVENERRNLAQELHDETLQSLIALGQYTQFALHWNKDPKVEKTLDQVMNLAEQGMKNMRRLVQGLRPIYIEDLGLATALEMQLTKNDRPDGVEIKFKLEGKERRLQPEVEMALYRIAQEAISNMIRHAQARNAWLSLSFKPHEIALEIHDDGQGFNLPRDPIHYARMGHYGLLGLYERAELIGAKLTIQSSPGKGTKILLNLPTKN